MDDGGADEAALRTVEENMPRPKYVQAFSNRIVGGGELRLLDSLVLRRRNRLRCTATSRIDARDLHWLSTLLLHKTWRVVGFRTFQERYP